jgi:hypothetical protein
MADPESMTFGPGHSQVGFGGTAKNVFHLLFTRTPKEQDDASQDDSCIACCITGVLLPKPTVGYEIALSNSWSSNLPIVILQ